MAGIGIRLNKIFGKGTITTNLIGFGYSTMFTIAPMFLVIGAVALMQALLGYSRVGYAERELYSCTVLYIFIFALLAAAPFNSVLSKYLSDVIYNETYEDIRPCFFLGLWLNMLLAALAGIPFCVRWYLAGGSDLSYVFAGYCGYISLVLVFYSMLYLSICKDYKKISIFYLLGMTLTVLLSLFFVYVLGMEVTFSMLLALDGGFLLIASLELALVKSYFRVNSGRYREVLAYFRKYPQLVAANFLYTLGLFIHNFVFWNTDMRIEVAGSFVCMTSYDMASCLAMFTNISASVIFISRVEMRYHERYKAYSESVIGGRGIDIQNAKKRMFRQLSDELMNLARIQFIISCAIFFVCIVLLPRLGIGGQVMRIYPCLAAGYFILFLMYAAIIFLYYFNDLKGAVLTAASFCGITFLGSLFSSQLSAPWYGLGLVAGAFTGFCAAYHRLRVMERTLDIHVFCQGSIMKAGHGRKLSNLVYGGPTPKMETKLEKKRGR